MSASRNFIGLLGEEGSHEIKEVAIKEEKKEYWACPHCEERLHEKGDPIVNLDEWKSGEAPGVYKHSCGGHYKHPPISEEQQSWLDDLKNGTGQFGNCPAS